jgi:pheromone shutdown protein TraB
MSATPPGWAEALLRVFLKPRDSDSVSGDLLEEYRDSIHPVRGQRKADVWYVTQVLAFVSRRACVWAALFGAACVLRTAFDWLRPPLDFHTRSTVSTALGSGILVAAGFWASWRSGSFVAGAVVGIATTAIGAVISVMGAASLLAIWHDQQTLAAIRGSGGLSEVFELPFMMVLPGVVLGSIGGVVGATIKRWQHVSPPSAP